MTELNNLLAADNFVERFYDGGTEIHDDCEFYLLKMDNPLDKNKSIRLRVTDEPDLSFLNSFYDSEDLSLEEENTAESFESNLLKIYSFLKPVISNEIISVSDSRNGHLRFNWILTLEQADHTDLNSRFYSELDLDFQVWTGSVDNSIIEIITMK